MPKKPHSLYLIDASGYIFRAYYAIRPLSNSSGLPTNALFGFTSMLLKLLKDEKPDYVGVVFDVARKTFRNEKYPDYKANRAEPPADLIPQFPYFRKIVRALNLPVLELPNYEADDVIGTIARKLEKKKFDTVIVTGDKDMMQLVDENVMIFDSMKDKWIGVAEVKERFGVVPKFVADVLGLAGDSSDNIPGVTGVGEKTAAKLVQEYGPLEEILKNATHIKGKLGEKLHAEAEKARLSKELATIVTDCPLEYDLADFKLREPDTEALKILFEELEFRRFLSELAPQKTLSKEKYSLLRTKNDVKGLAKDLETSSGFAFDTETTSLNTQKASLVGLSLSFRTGQAFYIPVGHDYPGAPEQPSWDDVRRILRPVFENSHVRKYAQNAKYDCKILHRHGIDVEGLVFDTMIASYLIDPDRPHNLDDLSQGYLNHKTTTYKEMVGTGKKEKSFSQVELEAARDYSCEDADCTFRLVEILGKRLREEKLEALFRDIEIPLVKVLAKMEMNGVKIDSARLKKTSKEYEKKMKDLEVKVYREAGGDFNINSTKQLALVLFEKLKLPIVRKTKTGYSTDVEVLSELAQKHEVPRLLLEYRGMAKLKSTYLDALPELVDFQTGRIHTSFNQTIAASGRLSSSEPNLQNIPIRTEEGKKIREAFIAEKGNRLLSADYSQIELRILAHLTQDRRLLEAFAEGRDIHRSAAASIFGVGEDKVTESMRSVGKTVNFAVLYGQGAFSLSQNLEISVQEADRYIKNYFQEYREVARYKEKVLSEARRDKIVRTLFGRLRRFPDIESPNANVRAMVERTAFNTIFQGTAADLIKMAMIRIQEKIESEFPRAMMCIQVHDELVFEVPKAEEDKFKKMIRHEMENVAKLSVPLKVDVGVGGNWAEAH